MARQGKKPMDLRAIFMGVLFALIWSSAFTSARIIVTEAPPLSALALRFAISGLIGVALARALGQTWRLSPMQWRSVFIFGLSQNALYLGLNFVAMQWIEASLAAIIASAMPLLVAAVNWIGGERLGRLGLAGLCAGFIGVSLIMVTRITGGADPIGLVMCIIGVGALAFATLSVRGAASGGNVLMVVGLQMLIGSAVLIPPALILEQWDVTWSRDLILAFGYTTIIPGLFATWVWFNLVARIGATRAATFHFLNPFFGVAIAALFLSERFGLLDAIGVTVIALGILAVQLSRQSSAPTKA